MYCPLSAEACNLKEYKDCNDVKCTTCYFLQSGISTKAVNQCQLN